MTISGIGSRSALGVQTLVDMRRQLDELQRQLATGKKSETYAGLGLDRGLAVGLRSRLSGDRGVPELDLSSSMYASMSRRPRSAGLPTSDAR